MIVLHGKGDSLRSFESLREELNAPGMNYLLLQAPKKYLDGFSWYPSEPRHGRSIRETRARLFRLVRELNKAGWKSQDLFWLGHSQGCLVACDLVLNHPHSFGGLVGVSGYVWFFRGWRQKALNSGALRTPWLLTHGTRDRVIFPREIREDVSQLLAGEVPVLYREFSKGHDFDYRKEVPFIRRWLMRPRSLRLSGALSKAESASR
jgi:phospholipase/carboxylesterase